MYLKITLLLLISPMNSWSKISLLNHEKKIIHEILKKNFKLNDSHLETIHSGEVVSEARVQSVKAGQSLELFTVGIHPKGCDRALKKISRYEDYKSYMNFLKESTYDESKQKIHLLISHTLLPFPMALDFNLPRIVSVGAYPFSFPHGIFLNLKGTIYVEKLPRHCLLMLKADWVGAHTGVTNIIVESFSQTLARLGLEHLIRFSSI
jgi:hypothetical protein